MDRVIRNRLLLAAAIFATTLGAFWLFERWSYNNPVVTITTDGIPTTLRIGDKQLELNQETTKLRLKRRDYSYLAIHQANRLYGNIDTLEKKESGIRVNFKIFSPEEVRRSLCRLENVELSACEYTKDRISVKLLGDNSWALVKFLPPDRGKINYIALRLENGRWEKVADSDDYGKDFRGLVPEYVSREVR